MILDDLFIECRTRSASDIHIKEWEQTMLRVAGELIASKLSILPDKKLLHDVLLVLLWGNVNRLNTLSNNLEIDFWYMDRDGYSYRGNAYAYMWKIGIALRCIPQKVKNLVELWLPKSLSRVLQAKQWIFLVTGPTGSGKSTTMASMLEAINEFRSDHIITIEDPVEYVFKNQRSYFVQREIGRDTHSFAKAVRSAMREDADIIMIGEIRDAETMEIALGLAETGHLVFSTLHTSGSIQTITRMLQFFSPEIEVQIRTRIADSLVGVLSQRLVRRKDNSGEVAIRELMFVNSGIRNLITKWDLNGIPNAIEMGADDGMFTMKKSAETLRDQWTITEKDYKWYFVNENL